MTQAAMPSRLEEIEAIKQLKYRYFRLVDTANWAELAGCFVESATVRYVGGSYHVERSGRDAILDYLASAIHSKCIAVHQGGHPRNPPDLAVDGHRHVVPERLVPRPAQQHEALGCLPLRRSLRQGGRRVEDRPHGLRAALRDRRAAPRSARAHRALAGPSRAASGGLSGPVPGRRFAVIDRTANESPRLRKITANLRPGASRFSTST